MKKFSGYDEIEANNFDEFERLTLGGHYCKVLDVRIDTVNYNGGSFDQLVLKFDIDEPDKQAGFYSRAFKAAVEKDATSARWNGEFKISIPKDDNSENDERTKKAFKTAISCIEKSNEGYSWEKADWDEKTLIGKKFIGVFGIEEYRSKKDDKLTYATKCRFMRSTKSKVEEISIPKVRLEDKSYIEYDEWVERRKAEREGTTFSETSNPDIKPIDDLDDLPF